MLSYKQLFLSLLFVKCNLDKLSICFCSLTVNSAFPTARNSGDREMIMYTPSLAGTPEGTVWVGSQGVEYFHLEYFKYLETLKLVGSLKTAPALSSVPALFTEVCVITRRKQEKEIEWRWNFISSFQCFSEMVVTRSHPQPHPRDSSSSPCLCFLLPFLCGSTLSRDNQGVESDANAGSHPFECFVNKTWAQACKYNMAPYL